MSKTIKLLMIVIMSAYLLPLDTISADHKVSVSKDIHVVRGPRGLRGHRGHYGRYGNRGKNGSKGEQGPPGPSAFPAKPIGAGYQFTDIQGATTVSTYNTPTNIGWNLITPPTTPLISWNTFYSGGSFTDNNQGRLTYIGTNPVIIVIRAAMGGHFADATANSGFGFGVNGNDPLLEQQINETFGRVPTGQQINLSGEILITLNNGDYIEPYVYTEIASSNLMIDFLNVKVSQWNQLH